LVGGDIFPRGLGGKLKDHRRNFFLKLCVSVGLPQHEVEQRWTAEEFDELFDAWLHNVIDVDGMLAAGTMVSWLMLPHYGREANIPPPEMWRCFMPGDPTTKKSQSSESVGEALKGAYGG
jgi:hypothetical protein